MFKLKISDFKNKNILLLTHENADLDTFTSTAIFQRFLKNNKINSSIGIPSHINEQTLHFAFSEKISFIVNPNLEEFDLICIFDFNDYEQLGKLREEFIKLQKKKCFEVITFDHHEIEKRSIAKGFINKNSFSTTQLLLDVIGKKFDKKMFFYAAIGILEDTGRFIVADKKLFEDFSKCLNNSNKKYSQVYEFAKHIIPQGEKIAFLKAAKRSEIKKINHIEIMISEIDFYQGAAATKLLEFGANIALVFGSEKNGSSKLSARAETSFKETTNFNLMKDLLIPLQKVVGGEVGGHSGAAQWKGNVKKSILLKEIDKILTKKLLKLKIK